MKNVFIDFIELHNVCQEKGIKNDDVFFNTCKICGTFYGTLDKALSVCSDDCNIQLINLNKEIELAEIKAKNENWCLGQNIKIGDENAIIVISTFSIKQVAKGITRFNYLINFKEETFTIKNVEPLKIKYENVSMFRTQIDA